jgi:hypothetical protein
MFAAIASIMAATAGNMAEQQAKIAQLGQYRSRGKGQGRSNRIAPGAGMANIRAARKVRNVRRHRAQCRG